MKTLLRSTLGMAAVFAFLGLLACGGARPQVAPLPPDWLGAAVDDHAKKSNARAHRIRDYYKGVAYENGDRTDWQVPLEIGKCYWFVAVGEETVQELFLYLWDPDDTRVETERNKSNKTILAHCAARTGEYRLQAKVAEGYGHYFVGAFRELKVGEAPPEEKPPEKPAPAPTKRVVVKRDKIEINEKIQFEQDKAIIKPVSFELLDEIAGVIQSNAHIKKIRIEGHASSEGPDQHNLVLTDRRAKAVREYLIKKGVEADRLEAQGYGETKPVADDETDEGRKKNRRVEFNILEQELRQVV